jgi:hypothetical protein
MQSSTNTLKADPFAPVWIASSALTEGQAACGKKLTFVEIRSAPHQTLSDILARPDARPRLAICRICSSGMFKVAPFRLPTSRTGKTGDAIKCLFSRHFGRVRRKNEENVKPA